MFRNASQRPNRFSKRPPKRPPVLTLASEANKNNGYIKASIDDMLPPNSSIDSAKKPMSNRCCYFSPESNDFGQIVEMDDYLDDIDTPDCHSDQYQQMLQDQYGFDPVATISEKHLLNIQDLVNTLCTNPVNNSSQYVNKTRTKVKQSFVETSDGTQWQNIDTADEIDRIISEEAENAVIVTHKIKGKKRTKTYPRPGRPIIDDIQEILPTPENRSPGRRVSPHKKSSRYWSPQRNIIISETPRVKIIAEKFSKLKEKDIEIRKLEEKVVCLEYNVCEKAKPARPIQKLRVFFSIKPLNEARDEGQIESTETKPTFIIADEDLKRLNDKEIEIIDGKIAENRSYLKDLRKILKGKQELPPKTSYNLDLMYLYEMAKNEEFNSSKYAEFLTKNELKEVKELILNRAASSVHGINRRKVSPVKKDVKLFNDSGIISQSFYNELVRETEKANDVIFVEQN